MPSRSVILLLLIWASVSAWGQQTMPEWLAPFPQARDQSAAVATEITSSYTAPAQAADVIAHYERQMRTAGVTFKTQSDGIGVSIVASAERASAVVRTREDDGVSKVKVSYAVTPDKTAGLVLASSRPPSSSSPSSGRREPLSPYARVPYTWILNPGAWSVYPIKCSGIEVFLR